MEGNELKNLYHKIEYDKYYTPIDLSKKLIEKTFEIIGKENITEIIEPSAGSGSFSDQIDNCIAYDIKPEGNNIIEQDFLKLQLEYKPGRLFIGNPPFGQKAVLFKKFINKCKIEGDYISFISNSSFHNYNRFDGLILIYSEYLGIIKYGEINVDTSFVIYRKDINKIYIKPNIEFIENIKTIKRTNKDKISFIYNNRNYMVPNLKIDNINFNPFEHFDIFIGNYGRGNIGKILNKLTSSVIIIKIKPEFIFLKEDLQHYFKNYHKLIKYKRSISTTDILEYLENFEYKN